MDAGIPFQQVLEIAEAASGDAAEVDPTGPLCVLPLLRVPLVSDFVPGEAGSAAQVQCNFVQQDGEKLSAGSPGMPAIIPHPMQGLANILQVAVDRCREGLPSSANGKRKAGIKECEGTGGGGQAGGEASIAASASRKTGRTTGSSDDEDLINPFKKKKLNASSNVLAVRDRFSARDVEEPLADVSSQEFKMLKCLVISNWLDLDGSAFQHELWHLKDLDRHLLRVSTTAKMRSVNMDDLLGYRDAVLAEMKGQDMDEDDGGFPGVGSAADEMDEAWGWETTNFM